MEGKLKGEQTHLLFPLPKIIRVCIPRFRLEVGRGVGGWIHSSVEEGNGSSGGLSDDIVFASLAAIVCNQSKCRIEMLLHHIWAVKHSEVSSLFYLSWTRLVKSNLILKVQQILQMT